MVQFLDMAVAGGIFPALLKAVIVSSVPAKANDLIISITIAILSSTIFFSSGFHVPRTKSTCDPFRKLFPIPNLILGYSFVPRIVLIWASPL